MAVRKKFEKLKDRERESELQKEEKLIQQQHSAAGGTSVASVAGRMKLVAKTTARLGKKMSCGDV